MSYVMTIRLPDGATLKRPAREAAGLLEVTVADDDVAGIPDLRADVAELGGEVVTENGSTSPGPAPKWVRADGACCCHRRCSPRR